MELQRVNSGRLHEAIDMQQPLKVGDITKGKILKLYPNQKATIQLGNQKMVAQLEAPLSTFASYYFQVQHSSSDVIHLKVLHDQSQRNSPDNPSSLLQFLGLKITKPRLSLLNTFIRDKVPFGKTQLTEVFQLLDMASDKGKSQSILKEMILRKLPLTEDTFHALSVYKKSSVSAETRGLMLTLREEPTTQTNQELQDMLKKLLVKPQNAQAVLTHEITSELKQQTSSFYNVLKVLGTMEDKIDLSQWRSLWSEKKHTEAANSAIIPLPTGMKDMPTVLHHLHHANQNWPSILSESKTILNDWGSTLHQALIHEKGLGTTEFASFNNALQSKLMPQLTVEHSEMMQVLLSKNNASSLSEMLNLLQTLSKQQTFQQVQHFLTMVKTNEALFALTPKEQFMQQLNHLFMAGVGVEKHTPDALEQSQTMKSLLIQLIQNSDGVVHDKANQLIHFLNGLQMQSVHETANFIEASIQIPAEKLGLNGDMFVDVSSQKNESGEINPDYCHILFYLDLANIRETVIDMQIQKRKVKLTILNEHQSALQALQGVLKDTLKVGLGELDYELQTIQFKPYHTEKEQEIAKKANVYSPIHQGVDYRV